ncbi:MAG: hypothetical protein RIT27_1456 [Pseudomonadota bacterium]|jgi:UDP-2,3-diacylglucosamine hydrolase
MAETLFIADLHLDEHHLNTIEVFQNFLTRRVKYSAGLYILGDLFESWIGDDDNNPYIERLKNALKKITSNGVPIYFMRGNRDFLIGQLFAQQTGCQLLEDETIIYLNGKRILLMHGDTLCTKDIRYQQLRKKLHNKTIQQCYLTLPLFIRRSIATYMRQKSHQSTRQKLLEIMDVSQNAVNEIMQKHQVTYLIHGHIHRPAHYQWHNPHQTFQRFVVDMWNTKGNALVFDEQHFKLEYF